MVNVLVYVCIYGKPVPKKSVAELLVRALSRKTLPGIETPYPSLSFIFNQIKKLLAHQRSSNILPRHYTYQYKHGNKVLGHPPNWSNSCDKRFDHTNDNDDVAESRH